MARILNREQQLRVAGIYPISAYSRVISVFLNIPQDGNWHYAHTPPVGNKVWLLRCTVRHCARSPNVNNYTNFELVTGTARARAVGDLMAWSIIIQNMVEAGPSITLQLGDGCICYQEDMSRLYTGENRRFGVVAKRVGAGVDQFFTSFLIAEG